MQTENPILLKANEIAEAEKELQEFKELYNAAQRLCFYFEDRSQKQWRKLHELRSQLADLATHSLDEPPQP